MNRACRRTASPRLVGPPWRPVSPEESRIGTSPVKARAPARDVAAGVGAQHPQPGAVVDRGELVVLLAPQSLLAKGFDELHIDLQLMTRALLFIPLPADAMPLVALRGR